MPTATAEHSRVFPNVLAACFAVFAGYVTITAVIVAVPMIQTGLHASTSDMTWVIDAQVVPMAAFVITGGVLGDLFGRRRVLLAGLALAGVGAVVGMCSGSSVGLLWAAQAVVGAGVAMLLPSSLSVIAHAIPDPHRRSHAIGAWASGLGLALVSGAWLTSLVINGIGANWPWLYAPVLVLALAGVAVVLWGVDESTAHEGRSFDVSGQVSVVLFVVALVYAAIEGPERGWASAVVVSAFVLAAVALVGLVIVERRSASPMLDLRLFRSAAFSVSSFVAVLVMFGLVGALTLLSLFFGTVQQLSVSSVAVRFLVLLGAFVLAGPLAARLSHAAGNRATITAGLVVAGIGLLVLSGLDAGTTFAELWWRLAIIGLGCGFVIAPITSAAVASVPHHLAGVAAASSNAFRQLGGALGPAVLIAVLTSRVTTQLPEALTTHRVNPAVAAGITHLVDRHGIQAVSELPASQRTRPVLQAAADASASALHTAAAVGGIAMFVAALVVLVLLRPSHSSVTSVTPAKTLVTADE